MQLAILIFAIIAIVYILTKNINKTKNQDFGIPGLKGRVIWRDNGSKTRPFFNSEFRIFGKPDLICICENDVVAVEYKSRSKGFYDSDINQAKAAALAARGNGFKVTVILLVNKTQQKKIRIDISDKQLYGHIAAIAELAREAKQGKPMRAAPNKYKCNSCSQNINCSFKEGVWERSNVDSPCAN